MPQTADPPTEGGSSRRWPTAGTVAGVVWIAAGVALALLVVVLLRFSGFIDVAVYEWAGTAVLDGRPLYVTDGTVLPFVYPPIAALLFVPLALLPAGAAAWMSLLSLAALARICWLLAEPVLDRLEAERTRLADAVSRPTIAAALFTLLAVLEPSVETLRLGQVSLILLWLVVEDLRRPEALTRGALTGLAAAIKVVPGFFLLFYAVVGRFRVAVTGIAAFLLATAVAWVVLPADSAQYWFRDLLSTGRLGAPIDFVGNQSLAAAWARTTGVDPSGSIGWLVVMVLVVVTGLWLCRRLWHSEAHLIAFGFAALLSLLVSPVSWTHHWVFLYPLLVGLVAATTPRWMLAVVAVDWVVLLSRIVWRVPLGSDGGLDRSLLWWPIANAYVIVGLLTAGAVVTMALRSAPERQRIGKAA